MQKTQLRHASGALAAVTLCTLSACGGGSDAPTNAAAATRGTIAVSVATNAAACGLDAVTVTPAKLRLHRDVSATAGAAGWEELQLPATPLNLLQAPGAPAGNAVALGELALPTGLYTQAILVLDVSKTVTARRTGASSDVALETDAALAAGSRLPIDLPVAGGQTLPLVLDLDACNALQPRGAAMAFKPRPRAVPATVNGMGGYLDAAYRAMNARLTAQKSGAIYATAVAHPTTGEFALTRLAPGNYDLVVQAPGAATLVIGSVPVAATGITSVATATAPLAPVASAVSAISGTLAYTALATAPADGTWVAVSQTIPANLAISRPALIVTYRFQPADLDIRTYALQNLPRARLRYAPYQAALPLTPAPIATALGDGHYRVETVASGYGNKTTVASANVDVSAGDASGIDIAITTP